MVHLDILPLLVPLQSVAFFKLFFSVTDAYDMVVFVSGYQLLDMHCMALPVKFDGGLFISLLRKSSSLKKKKKKKKRAQNKKFFKKIQH
jgi:hypothetical protein